jgi:hypothetical protein
MAKDVNIHVKTTGTQETKQQLEGVGRAIEEMGAKTSRAASWMKDAFGAIGGVAVLAAIAAAAGKISQFFDNIKTRADEAVRKVQELRSAYQDLFEALDAFDEKSRQIITKKTNLLLQQTATPQAFGLPIINAYTRQFGGLVKSGQLTQGQYDQGLKEMLGWGVRHGGGATPELITMMAGWGMNTPQQQGEFRRMISAASQATGLTDEELIDSLSRGMPTIKAMGWTPQQALETTATLAAGEVGRKKTAMPAAVFQALMTPQLTDIKKMGIPEKIAEDPRQLLAYLEVKRGQISQKAFLDMLIKIYGGEAAPGIFKLLGAPRGDISDVLRQAAGPEGIKAEQREEIARKTTLEGLDAATKAKVTQIELDITKNEEYMKMVREIGAAEREKRRLRHPWWQWIREIYFPGIGGGILQVNVPEEQQKEDAAYRDWLKNLTPEEKRQIPFFQSYREFWEEKTPQQKYGELMQPRGNITINNYNIGQVYTPRVGSDERGPRAPANIK